MTSRYYFEGRKPSSPMDLDTIAIECLTCKDMVEKDNHESENKNPEPVCVMEVVDYRGMKHIDLLTDEEVRNVVIDGFSEFQTQDIIRKCKVFYDFVYNKLLIITDPQNETVAYEPEFESY